MHLSPRFKATKKGVRNKLLKYPGIAIKEGSSETEYSEPEFDVNPDTYTFDTNLYIDGLEKVLESGDLYRNPVKLQKLQKAMRKSSIPERNYSKKLQAILLQQR